MRTIFSGGMVRCGGDFSPADWLLVEDGVIAGVGLGTDRPAADRTVDLGGAALLPAFRDAHVHLPATGLQAAGLDFRDERSAAAIKGAFAERAAQAKEGVLFGGNFEDPLDAELTGTDLDEAVGDRPALLARADLHSCVVSSNLLAELDLDGLVGVDRREDGSPTGYLREQAASQAWAWYDRHLTAQQQQDAVEAAVKLAYSKGVAEVHEMFVVEWRGWAAAEAFALAIRDVALDVAMFLGTDEIARVKEAGLPRIGGDYFLDGSFGSYTAWLTDAYTTAPPAGSPETGISYRDGQELFEFLRAAQTEDLQVGVHAIGDAAIEQAISTWERVAQEVGAAGVRAKGHRIEHFECASDDHIARAARLGLRASVQPAFDKYWGGEDGLYAQRIGWDRAASMNRFATMQGAGLVMAAGSDSTVTPLDPFLQMASLRDHHVPAQRLDPAEALRMTTTGPAAIAGHEGLKGTLAEGLEADLVLLDRDPLEIATDELSDTEVLGTWIKGSRVWPPHDAEGR